MTMTGEVTGALTEVLVSTAIPIVCRGGRVAAACSWRGIAGQDDEPTTMKADETRIERKSVLGILGE
jgi:hypothetical protein